MAVSGSTDFSVTGTDIVTKARSLLGIQPAEETLQAHELEEGLFWLNAMMKAWEADGVMIWTFTEGTLTLVDGQASYLFGSGGDFTTAPVDIDQMRVTRYGIDLEITRMSRQDYFALPNKTATGYPNQWFYDRQRDNGRLYLWPVPDSVATTAGFTYRRRIMDVDAGTDTFDLPQEWTLAVVYGLAVQLTPIYGKSGTPRANDIKQTFGGAYLSIKGFDNGEGIGSVRVIPDRVGGYR